jgi:hypothetical protein
MRFVACVVVLVLAGAASGADRQRFRVVNNCAPASGFTVVNNCVNGSCGVAQVSGADCPNGVCPLPKATYAGPVSSCAGGSCAAPVERRGLFGFRRW